MCCSDQLNPPRKAVVRRADDHAGSESPLLCRKATELGYPHELWTTRLLARHAREHSPAEGHPCPANTKMAVARVAAPGKGGTQILAIERQDVEHRGQREEFCKRLRSDRPRSRPRSTSS